MWLSPRKIRPILESRFGIFCLFCWQNSRFRCSFGQYFGAIARVFPKPKTGYGMARYSPFLGRKVEVHYRAGDILLPASGTFVADSGRSIFLEQHLTQRGQVRNFRWEIPYQYIVRLEEVKDLPFDPSHTGNTPLPPVSTRPKEAEPAAKAGAQNSLTASAAAAGSVEPAVILPLGRPGKST